MKIKIPNYLKFSTFVWLLSVFLTATCFMIFDSSTSNSGLLGGPLNVFLLMISIGAVFSIPNWILLCIATWKINQLQMTTQKKKIIINAIAVGLTFLLFFLLPYFTSLQFDWKAGIYYSLTVSLGIWIFPLRNKITAMIWEEHILDDNIF